MEKVSAFALFVLPCRDEANDLCKQTQQMRNVYNVFNEVKKLILLKDISEEKLKNTALLKIELPKFEGYHSSTDSYTFKEEFQILIEPNYFKRNYLTGCAYSCCKNG